MFGSAPVDRLDSLELHLRRLVHAARRGGTQLVLVEPQHRFSDTIPDAERQWLRALERMIPKASGRMLIEFSALAAERIRTVAVDSGVAIFRPDFPIDSFRPRFFADATHFTDSGAALVAASVAEEVGRLLACGK